MNKKLDKQIIKFINSVGRYIFLEYDYKYLAGFKNKEFLNNRLYDFIGGYYLGGNNVPDTSRYVVDLIQKEYL